MDPPQLPPPHNTRRRDQVLLEEVREPLILSKIVDPIADGLGSRIRIRGVPRLLEGRSALFSVSRLELRRTVNSPLDSNRTTARLNADLWAR